MVSRVAVSRGYSKPSIQSEVNLPAKESRLDLSSMSACDCSFRQSSPRGGANGVSQSTVERGRILADRSAYIEFLEKQLENMTKEIAECRRSVARVDDFDERLQRIESREHADTVRGRCRSSSHQEMRDRIACLATRLDENMSWRNALEARLDRSVVRAEPGVSVAQEYMSSIKRDVDRSLHEMNARFSESIGKIAELLQRIVKAQRVMQQCLYGSNSIPEPSAPLTPGLVLVNREGSAQNTARKAVTHD